jgi:hypothetical protein
VVFTLAFAPALTAHGKVSDEYRVYDAVVGAMFARGVTRFDMNTKVERIVVRDRTHSEYAWGPTHENWQQVKYRLPSLKDETIDAYESVCKKEVGLNRELNIPLKYEFVTEKVLKEIFPLGQQASDPVLDRWKVFYERYPRSAGYNSFSRIGFDKARQQALVYFVNWCGSHCGTGTYLLLEKKQNVWAVKESGGMWIS